MQYCVFILVNILATQEPQLTFFFTFKGLISLEAYLINAEWFFLYP